MAPGRGKDGFYAVCDCCALQFPAREALVWRERTKARRLKILESATEPAERSGNPYREYEVEHLHRVCPACHADLLAGGRFRSIRRNRSKMAVAVVAAALALLIVTLPITLPHILSAFWLLPGERVR
jgi:hypothetical protein